MLAGVLVRFGMDVFMQIPQQPVLIISMLLSYLIAKRIFPRYAILLVLIVGTVVAGFQGLLNSAPASLAVTMRNNFV